MIILTLAGTACIAWGAMLLAASLTRFFALLYPPAAVFLLLAISASGLVAGALAAHRFGWLPSRRRMLAAGGATAAGVLAVLLAATLVLGASATALVPNGGLSWLVFGALGMALAAPYLQRPLLATGVFAAQALGAGLAAAAHPALIDALGPEPAALLAAVAMAAGALGHALAPAGDRPRHEERSLETREGRPGPAAALWLARVLCAIGVALPPAALGADLRWHWLRLDPAAVASPKSLFASIHAGDPQLRETPVFSAWDSAGRVDVTEPAGDPDLKWVYLDGSVAGLMHRATADGHAPDALRSDLAALPFSLPGAHQSVLLVGGGGTDTALLALDAGASEIVVAETSAALIAAGRRFASFDGGVFDRPGVRVVRQDGRSLLRESGAQFDLIILAAEAAGSAQLGGPSGGAHLFTREAINDYLNHLRQDGRLVLALRNEQELTRAFDTAFQVLTGRGASPVDAIRRLVAINDDPVAGENGVAVALPLLIVRKTPYIEGEARAIFEALQPTPYRPLFMPYLETLSPLGAFAAEGIGPEAVEARVPYDIHPVGDEGPFFFEFDKGFPITLLAVPLVIALVAGGIALLARRPDPESALGEEGEPVSEEAVAFLEDEVPWRFLGFATLTSAGFMLAHLPLAFRLPLLIGQPALASAVAYGAALLGGTAGSLLAARAAPDQLRPAIGWAGLAGGLYTIALLELLPMAETTFGTHPLTVRTAVAAVLVAPLGLCLGVAFPATVRLLAGTGRGGWAAALFASAALAAIVAAFVSLTIGLTWGFAPSRLLGAAGLLVAFMIAGLRLLVAGPEPAPAEPGPVAADHVAFQRPVD